MEQNESFFKKIFSWTNIGLAFLTVVAVFSISQLVESWKPEEPLAPLVSSEEEDFFAEEAVPEIVQEPEAETALLQPLVEKKFVIQVAAFRGQKGADAVVEELKKKGYEPIIKTEDSGSEGALHRVYAGAFETKDQAQSILDEVKKDYPGSFIKQL
ncbi:MAG: SPOR domain-containing protein [Candidatus Aceula meridiana]|nr:SPOR domain-containing protein [Candidatus Aceula meridiana]